jgi:RHS repeat-associated protein
MSEGTPAATSGTPQHVAVSGSRGNLTTTSQLVQGATTLTSHVSYYDTGTPNTSTDVNSAVATYHYADATSTCGNAFPTSLTITQPISMTSSTTWACTGGVQLTATDENAKTVTNTYNDPYFWRPNIVTDQLGNQAGFWYQPNPQACCPPGSGWFLTFNNNNSVVGDWQYRDGLGRTYVDQHLLNPTSTNLDSVSYTFDSNGRPYSTSQPCTIGASGTCSTPKTTQTYDALNRPLVTTDGGGGTTTNSYTGNDVLVTVGPAPTGENTKRRQLEYDSLGRLTSACEITGGTGSGACGQTSPQTGFWTKYTYDALGNLLTVTQNAQSTGQTRSYTYDAMSRLVSETNPETGASNYTYDTNTTCGTSSGDLVKRTDAVGNTTCYAYDALHRVTSTTYSGPYAANTPNKYFVYDAATVNGAAMANAKTRLAEAYTATSQNGTKITDLGFSYTARGEVSDVYQSTPNSGGYYHVTQAYWANGARNQLSGLPGLSAITYGLDGEGRPNSTSAASGQNPVTSALYNVFGSPYQVNFGSGDSDTFGFDSNTARMNQYQFTINGVSVTGALTWNPNGTLQKLAITNPVNSADNQTCNYAYDDLTRIGQVDCGSAGWGQSFAYDPFGNLTKTVLSGHSGNSFQPTYSTATNRMTSLPGFTPTYDANGNVLSDNSNTYFWNAENRPATINGGNWTYDALGRPVEPAGASFQIVYAPTGERLAYMQSQTFTQAFVPLPGGATVIYNSSGVSRYRHPDWLGSARVTSTPQRGFISSTAYAPFGEPYATLGSLDPNFTGQESVSGAGLFDFPAREYSNQGRWASPDPAGLAAVDPSNPQSWNRYAYVGNDPLDLVDPTGLYPVCLGGSLYDEVDSYVDGAYAGSDYTFTGNQCGRGSPFLPTPLYDHYVHISGGITFKLPSQTPTSPGAGDGNSSGNPTKGTPKNYEQ